MKSLQRSVICFITLFICGSVSADTKQPPSGTSQPVPAPQVKQAEVASNLSAKQLKEVSA